MAFAIIRAEVFLYPNYPPLYKSPSWIVGGGFNFMKLKQVNPKFKITHTFSKKPENKKNFEVVLDILLGNFIKQKGGLIKDKAK